MDTYGITLDEAFSHPAGQSSAGRHTPTSRLWRRIHDHNRRPSTTDSHGVDLRPPRHLPRSTGGLCVSWHGPMAPTLAGRPRRRPVACLSMSYYETLLHSDNKGNLIPWLAESYKVADDQKSITFTIRKGVKFSDGSDLTADVVKWNLEQYMAPAGGAEPPAGASCRGSSRRRSGRDSSRRGRSSRRSAPPAGAPAGAPPAGPPAGARGATQLDIHRGGRSEYRSGQLQRPGTTLSRPPSATPIRRSTWSPRRRMTRTGKSG